MSPLSQFRQDSIKARNSSINLLIKLRTCLPDKFLPDTVHVSFHLYRDIVY